ncbi:MAG: (2Fe-2S)-binding protein [Acidobacteria bacterium]|nr:(2Fe-2S)-binding protein [Acidobacteriota bacterium]
MSKTAKVTVDGRSVDVPDNSNALEACRAAGVEVPHFCYHPGLSIVGQCRMCMVEIEGMPKIAASCTVPIRDGMVIKTDTEKAHAARNSTMEFLLINHPLDCPICDQAGECKLQDNAVTGGLPVSRTSEARRQYPGYERTDIGKHVIADMTRCIQCTRCIRFCEEITETGELSFIERGGHTIVWTHEGRALDNELSGCAADVCPVGALTTKEFRFRKRAWWLDKTRSVCTGCEVGCNIAVEHKDRVVHRFIPRVNADVNDFWICDFGRFRSEELNEQELFRPVVRGKETSWGDAQDAIKAAVDAAQKDVLVLGSAKLSTETNWLAAQLFGKHLGANVEFVVDRGDRHRVKNKKADGNVAGWLEGYEAAPNSRGAEAAGVTRGGDTGALAAVLTGTLLPKVIIVLDAAFSAKAEDPAVIAALRKAGTLIVCSRRRSALAAAADVLLPVGGVHNDEGTFVNVQGRVQRFDCAYIPPPIVRTQLEILTHLGKKWGLFDTRWTARSVFEEMRATVPGYAGLDWDSPALVGSAPSASPAAPHDVLEAPAKGGLGLPALQEVGS